MSTNAWDILYSKILPAKIPRPAPSTGRPGRAQSGRTPEFGYGPSIKMLFGKGKATIYFKLVHYMSQHMWDKQLSHFVKIDFDTLPNEGSEHFI